MRVPGSHRAPVTCATVQFVMQSDLGELLPAFPERVRVGFGMSWQLVCVCMMCFEIV
jgi:hypothetical protein